MAVSFAGKIFIEPGAYVVTDFDATPKVSGQSSSRVLLLAESEKGLDFSDKKVYAFQTPTTAKSVLGGGPALDLINCLFSPSPDYSGASEILFVRTNKGYNASLQTVKTGSPLNKVRFSVTGATAGRIGFDISIAGKSPVTVYADIKTELAQALGEIVKDINTLNGVSATTDGSSVVVTALYPSVSITLSNSVAPTAATTEISTLTQFAPEFVDNALVIKTIDKGHTLNYAFKKSADVCTFYKDDAIIASFEGVTSIAKLLAEVENTPSLTRLLTVTAKDTTLPLPDDMASPIPLTVREDDATTFDTFQDALNMTLDYSKNFVISQFEGEAYHQAILSYCNASTYQCIGFGGGSLNETPSQVLERAFNLNAEAFVLCYPGVYLGLTGESKLYSPAYHAALECGLACGLPVYEPLTFKSISCLGFEEVDLEGRDSKGMREELINGGVLYAYAMPDVGNKVNKGINTIQGQVNRQILETDNKTHEISIARIRRQIANEIRISAQRAFPGRTRLYPSKADVIEFLRAYFNRCVGTLLTGWDAKSLIVRVEEDAWIADAKLYANGPINHFFATISLGLDNNL